MSQPSWVNTKPAMGCSKKHAAIILSITNTITVIAIVVASERLATLIASSRLYIHNFTKVKGSSNGLYKIDIWKRTCNNILLYKVTEAEKYHITSIR